MAYSRCNDRFLISSVSQTVVRAVCASFMRNMSSDSVRIVILSFPQNAITVKDDGTLDSTGCTSTTNSVLKICEQPFVPFKWTAECTDIVRRRVDDMQFVYKKYEVMQEMLDNATREIAELKRSLGDELIAKEDRKTNANRESRRACKKVEDLQRMLDAERMRTSKLIIANAALKTSIGRAREYAADVARQYRTLQTFIKQRMDKMATSMNEMETSNIIQLLKVTLQCNHYFTTDRFTSIYFRRHIRRDANGTERIMVSTVAMFPRLRLLCAGDHGIISAACNLLDLQVKDGWILLQNAAGSHCACSSQNQSSM